jgi:hypothetical protein
MRRDENIMESKEVNINIPSVDNWTIKDLKYTCKRNNVKGYTKMNREQLIQVVKEIINNMKK